MRTTTDSVADVASRVSEDAALRVLLRHGSKSIGGLIAVAGALAAKHIYLDPRDPAAPDSARSYCGLCLRYGLNFQAIDHAPSCLVGQALAQVAAVRELLPNPTTERRSADNSAAPVEQWGAAVEGLSCAQEVDGETKERRIVYLADPFSRMKNFNPYQKPCPGIRGGVVCEMEEGHAGDCCRDGATWTDNPTHRDDAAMNGAPGNCGGASDGARRFA